MNRIAVLQLVGNFNTGGSERQAVQLTRSLHATGRYETHVACLDARGPLRQEMSRYAAGEILEYPLKAFYRPSTFAQAVRLARNLRRLRISILHTHDFYSNILGMAAGFMAGTSVRIASRRELSEFRGLRRGLELAAYRLSHCVLANSKAVAERLVTEGVNPGKTAVIYNSLDEDRVRRLDLVEAAHAAERLGLPFAPSARYVTLLANMRKAVKNQAMLLRAAQLISARNGDVHYILAGEGELVGELRAQAAALGIAENVHFIGRCDLLPELLAVSNIGVLTSKAEGFSNVIVEYMAGGLPVVATDVGGAREAVEEGATGYVVQSDDHQALADRILRLLDDPALAQEMGARGRAIALSRFSPSRQLAETEELYARLGRHHSVDKGAGRQHSPERGA